MPISRTIFVVVVLSLSALACGQHDHDEGAANETASTKPMTERIDALQSELDELEELVTTHGEQVKGAADLVGVTTEETAYDASAAMQTEHVDHGVDDLADCEHHGRAPYTMVAMMALHKTELELSEHQLNMEDAADLAGAQAEEAIHQTAMAKLVTEMRQESDRLGEEATEFQCPHHQDVEAHMQSEQ